MAARRHAAAGAIYGAPHAPRAEGLYRRLALASIVDRLAGMKCCPQTNSAALMGISRLEAPFSG
jgi:hypothetical protein